MAARAMNMEASETPSTPALNLDIHSINLNFSVSYTDKTDPENPKSGHYQENVNLNFGDEAELNRTLTAKPYISLISPILAHRLVDGYDAENATAKEFKEAIKNALTPKS